MKQLFFSNVETDTKELLEYLRILTTKEKVAVDIETYDKDSPKGKKGLCSFQGEIRLIQFACEDFSFAIVNPSRGDNCDLPLFSLKKPSFLEDPKVISGMKLILEDRSIMKLLQNAKFDLGYFYRKFGIEALNIWDTRLASQVYYSGASVSHSLKDVVNHFLNKTIDKSEQKSDWGAAILTDSQLSYGLNDVEILLPLQKAQQKALEREKGINTYEWERVMIPYFVRLNQTGFCLDQQALDSFLLQFDDLKQHFSDKIKEGLKGCGGFKKGVEAKVDLLLEYFGEEALDQHLEEFTGSAQPAKLIAALERKYPGIDLVDPDTDKKSIGKKVTAILDLDKYPVVKDLVCYKTLNNLYQYAFGLKNGQFYIDGDLRGTGVFSVLASNAVGRSACSKHYSKCGANFQNPNKPFSKSGDIARWLQQEYDLPDLKSLMVAPPGKKLLIADFAAAHARIAADLSLDSVLLAIYFEDLDSHSMMVSGLTDALKIKETADSILKELDLSEAEYERLRYKGEFEETSRIRSDKKHPLSKLINRIRDAVAKNVFYLGLNVGGAGRLHSMLKAAGFECTMEQVYDILNVYKETYKGLLDFIDENYQKVNKSKTIDLKGGSWGLGEVKKMWIPRIDQYRWVPLRFDKDGKQYIKINDVPPTNWLCIEGRALKSAMRLAQRAFDMNPQWCAKIVVPCHDELVIECSEEYAYSVAIAVQYAMKTGLQAYMEVVEAVPLEDPSKMFADCWAEK